MKKNSNRSATIDILRIIAIIFVIACHIALPPIGIHGEIDKGRLIISCLVGDGVSIFLIISGFFMYRKENYIIKVKKMIKTIIIPSIVLIIFTSIFYNYITNKSSLLNCIKDFDNIKENIKLSLIGIANLNATKIPGAPHLWYIFTYITCYLWLPLITLIFDTENEESKLAKKMILFLGIFNLIVISISQICDKPFSYINTITIVPTALLLIIIGKIVYDKIDFIKNNKKIRYWGLSVYIIVSIIKILLQYILYRKNVANTYFLYWNSPPAIIESIGLVLFILSFDIKSNKVISNIGICTFGIYLIHWMIKEKFNYNGYFEMIQKVVNTKSSFISECLYTIISTIVIFSISLIIIEIIKYIKNIWRYYFYERKIKQ